MFESRAPSPPGGSLPGRANQPALPRDGLQQGHAPWRDRLWGPRVRPSFLDEAALRAKSAVYGVLDVLVAEIVPQGSGRDTYVFVSISTHRRGRLHEGLGSSELATPYRSRSAFASSVRPSASSASAVTWALFLIKSWSCPSILS